MRKLCGLLVIFILVSLSIVPVSAQSEQITGHFEWSKGEIIPDAGKVQYEITFIPDDSENYDTATTAIDIDIAQVEPNVKDINGEEIEDTEGGNTGDGPVYIIDAVTAIAFAEKGEPLIDVEISDYNVYDLNGNILAGSFVFEDTGVVLEKTGEYKVLFIPDNKNYSNIETKVYITVRSSGGGSSTQYYVVSYDTGEYGVIEGNKGLTEKVKKGDKLQNVPTIKMLDDNYKHIGWEVDGEMIDTSTYIVNSKVILKAVYIPINKVKYLTGYEGKVYPDNNITRAEAATLFSRILGDKEAAGSSKMFSDVNNSDWYFDYIDKASKHSIINGYEDNTFKPNNSITRAEMAVMIYRYMNMNTTAKSKFPDVTGHWAERYIAVLENLHILNGYQDNTFKPDDYITRAEAVKCINGMLGIDSSVYADEPNKFSDIDSTHWAYKDISLVVISE